MGISLSELSVRPNVFNAFAFKGTLLYLGIHMAIIKVETQRRPNTTTCRVGSREKESLQVGMIAKFQKLCYLVAEVVFLGVF